MQGVNDDLFMDLGHGTAVKCFNALKTSISFDLWTAIESDIEKVNFVNFFKHLHFVLNFL